MKLPMTLLWKGNSALVSPLLAGQGGNALVIPSLSGIPAHVHTSDYLEYYNLKYYPERKESDISIL